MFLTLIAIVIAAIIILSPAVQIGLAVATGISGVWALAAGHALLVFALLLVLTAATGALLVFLHRRVLFSPVPRFVAASYA